MEQIATNNYVDMALIGVVMTLIVTVLLLSSKTARIESEMTWLVVVS